MSRHGYSTDPRGARARRDKALQRAELRGPSMPHTAPDGPTSAPIKMVDPDIRKMIDDAIAQRRQ